MAPGKFYRDLVISVIYPGPFKLSKNNHSNTYWHVVDSPIISRLFIDWHYQLLHLDNKYQYLKSHRYIDYIKPWRRWLVFHPCMWMFDNKVLNEEFESCEQMLESKEAIKHHRQKYMFYDGMRRRGNRKNCKWEYVPWISKIV